MKMLSLLSALVLSALMLINIAQAKPFTSGDATAGKQFFEQNKCNRCHIQKMGGDGSAIFTRPNRIVNTPKQLIARMHYCSEASKIMLTPADEQNVGAFLNQTYYKFK